MVAPDVRRMYLIVALVVHRRAAFIYRGAQAVARGGARCGSKVAPRKKLSVSPTPLPAAAPVVRRGYMIVVPRPITAAPLVVFRRYLTVVPRSLPRRRDAVAAGEEQLC
jgi:hypothetical protein